MGPNVCEDLNLPDKTSPAVSRLPSFFLGLFHYSGVNLYANGSASCPLSPGARVGFPHSCRLTPPTLLLPLPQLSLISTFDPSLPSGVRGYLSQPVASLCLLSQTTTNLLTSYSWLTATGSTDYQWAASKWREQKNNRESVCWKYWDRKAPLYKWGQYFYFGCRYDYIFCLILHWCCTWRGKWR